MSVSDFCCREFEFIFILFWRKEVVVEYEYFLVVVRPTSTAADDDGCVMKPNAAEDSKLEHSRVANDFLDNTILLYWSLVRLA